MLRHGALRCLVQVVPSNSSVGPILSKRLVGSVGGADKEAGDYAPLAVAGFATSSISQSDQSASAINRITMVLSAYTSLYEQTITISGFRGAYRASARAVLRDESGDESCGRTETLNRSTCHTLLKSQHAPHAVGEATWNGTLAAQLAFEPMYKVVAGNKVSNLTMTGELRARTATFIPARQTIQVSFEVNNSAFGQSPPVISIYHANASVWSSSYNMTQPGGDQTVGFQVCAALSLAPLSSSPPSFLVPSRSLS